MSESGALLVLAASDDASAQAFVARASGALLLTPRDLSRAGWRLRLGDESSAIALAGGGCRLGVADIGGVLTRLPRIEERDLPHITAGDRAYVAAEMTAFLLAFLAGLRCRVANPPTPQCLCGPLWSPERWRRLGASLGLAVRSEPRVADLRAETPPPVPARGVVTIVGGAAIGAVASRRLADKASALARAAGADLLQVEFDGSDDDAALLRASPLVDLDAPAIAAAALALFSAAAPPIERRA